MGPYDDQLMRWVTEAEWRRRIQKAERGRAAERSRPKRPRRPLGRAVRGRGRP